MQPSTPPPFNELTSRLDALARSLGLNSPGGGTARGKLFGTDVRLEIRMRSELVFRARIPKPLPTGLQLESEQEAAATRRSVGFQDIQVGDAAFDERVHVRALKPAVAIRLLRDEVLLRQLPLFLTAHPRARLAGDELIVPLPSEASQEQILDVVKQAVELAAEFGRAAAADSERGQRHWEEIRETAVVPPSRSEGPQPLVPETAGRRVRPRPGAGGWQEQSGPAYLNRMRSSFRKRRLWMLILRLGPIPLVGTATYRFRHDDWTETLVMLGLLACAITSIAVWRCPACGSLLDKSGESVLKSVFLRSCPGCSITLNP